MKNRVKVSTYIYLGLWLLYWLQGILYASGTILSQGILALALVISVFYTYRVLIRYKMPKGLKAMAILYFTLLFVDTLRSIALGGGDIGYTRIDRVKALCLSFLPVMGCYYLVMSNQISERFLKIFAWLFLAVAIGQYWQTNTTTLTELAEAGSSRTEITNNSGYFFVSLIPFAFLFSNKRIIQYSFLAILIFFILSSMKRGAILIGAICIIFLFWQMNKSSKGFVKFGVVILLAVVFITGYKLVEQMLATSDYFRMRLQDTLEGNSSDRDILWRNAWEVFTNRSSFIQVLFGHANLNDLIENSAHNDWLDILLSYGLVGVGLFLNMFFGLYKNIKRYKYNVLIQYMGGMVIFSVFVRSFFSQSYADLSFAHSLMLAYCLAQPFVGDSSKLLNK